MSKLVECAVAARFVADCELNGLLLAKQSAYHRHRSTETAILTVYNIVRAVVRGQLTPLVLLDLSSAFDTVDRDCLLRILQNRFSVDSPDWFLSYLSDCSQTFIAANS